MTKATNPVTFDLEEIEAVIIDAAHGRQSGYHRLEYAWEALKRCGHKPRPEIEAMFQKVRKSQVHTDITSSD